MCNNKDHLKAYLRDRWAQHAHIRWQDARGARYAARRRCVLSCTWSLSCRGSRDSLTQVPQLWPNPSSQSTTVTHLSESFPAILVNPAIRVYSTAAQAIRLNPSLFIRWSLLHIIKITFIQVFDSFTCTGLPDLLDPGLFKFAGRNLVGLPISMPLIDTNWLLQVQVESEFNSDLSQVLVEDWSGSRPGHGPLTENEKMIALKNLAGRADGPAASAAGKVSRMALRPRSHKIWNCRDSEMESKEY